MNTKKVRANSALITPEMLKNWQSEDARLESKEKEIQQHRSALKMIMAGATAFMFDTVNNTENTPIKKRPGRPPVNRNHIIIPPKSARKPLRMKENGWVAMMLGVLENGSRGMTYKEVKDELAKTSIAQKLKESEKGFYGAIDKLLKKDLIVKHGNKLYSTTAYKTLQKAIAAGTVIEDEVIDNVRGSAMGDAIASFLKTKPRGAISAEIIADLMKNDDFRRRINANKSTPYNVISTLVKRRKVNRDGGIYHLASLKR